MDILCNNAGVLDDYKPIMDTSEELWDLIMGVNLKGMFLVTKALIPHMLENGGGVVVNTSSHRGVHRGGRRCGLYLVQTRRSGLHSPTSLRLRRAGHQGQCRVSRGRRNGYDEGAS